MTKQQRITKILFWGAFAVFLGVSVPHIAWVFHSYEPDDAGVAGMVWWALAYGFAIAIDAVVAWLAHIKSSGESRGDTAVTWLFIGILVLMSWYMNWVFAEAHNPAAPGAYVWGETLVDSWGIIPRITVGAATPVLISALPVFIIAYTLILAKVNQMKAEAQKSVAELELEAQEAARRAVALRTIREAGKGQGLLDRARESAKEAIGAAKEIGGELGVGKEKQDPQAEALQKVLAFFRGTPELLAEENARAAEVMICKLLKIRSREMAHMWRLKAAQVLTQEAENGSPETGQTVDEELDEIGTETEQTVDEELDEVGIENGPIFGQETDEDEGDLADEIRTEFEDLATIESGSFGQDTEAIPMIQREHVPDLADRKAVTRGLRSGRYISISDASLLTGYAEETLKRKANSGEIRYHPTDKMRLLYSSVRYMRNPKTRFNVVEFEADLMDEDKLTLTLEMLRENPDMTDEMLAEKLHMRRPASARFWRLKAEEVLEKEASVVV